MQNKQNKLYVYYPLTFRQPLTIFHMSTCSTYWNDMDSASDSNKESETSTEMLPQQLISMGIFPAPYRYSVQCVKDVE
jgi:hypothetical protein